MVHPYLRRRSGEEAVEYPSDDVREVLQRTLGVPIFQEQVMQLAVVAAGFTPGEADRLRRAMAAWKRRGGLGPFEQKLINGMRERGYAEDFARQIFKQIKGFGEYGFPESHSASFALLVYVSCWLKRHEPAAFTAALINSQPMGFYSASQLIQDLRRHGVEVRPVDVNESDWDCTLERIENGEPALRLGLRQVKGLSETTGRTIAERRDTGLYRSIQQLLECCDLNRRELSALAAAGALKSLEGHRHRARWAVAGVEKPTELIPSMERYEAVPMLSHRRSEYRRRLQAPRTDPGAPSHGTDPRTSRTLPLCLCRGITGPPEWEPSQGGGAGDYETAARDREWRHFRHPRGRIGLYESDRVEKDR
jgi:error-prone DNA polymerase